LIQEHENIQIKFSIFLLVFLFSVNAQIQALFNSKTQLRMTERWELDTTSLRGTFFGHSKPMYVLPVRWSTNPNERPKSGNLDPDYIAPAGVDYNNIELNFN
jgi:phospholipase A1